MLFINAKIYDNDFILQTYDMRVENGKITELADRGTITALPGEEVLDLTDNIIVAGMIDQHTHGALGADTMDGSEETINLISKHLARNGVTSFLPTTMTMGPEHLHQVFDNQPETTPGANVLGFHMEGPYINVEKKGAQNPEYVREASVEEISEYQKKVSIKIIDMAPEFATNLNFIREKSSEINLQIGHCMASYEDSKAALELGATGLCHGFNAMPGIHHRNPGPIIAALEAGKYTEIIADGLHIHPSVVVAAYKMFGTKRMILVSDALRTTGLDDGEYMFGGQPILLTDGVARVKATGALAGGSSNIWQEVKNCIEWGIPTSDALRMGSLTPAEYLNIADSKGSIAIGKDADFVISNEDFDVLSVYISGKKYEEN